jgi:Xaa-Pro aminopeptidase
MQAGTLWRTDFAARFTDGLKADVARTGVVGEATVEQQEIFANVRAVQDTVVAMIEPNRPAHDLYRAADREFARSGLPFAMPHVGHGIGVGLHEPPLLEPANATPLRPGMVLCIEPLAVIESRREGYHTEDLVVVTDDGHKRLTQPQQALLEIPAS